MSNYSLNTDYTKFSYQDFLADFYARLQNDERFANIKSASIYGMLMEMIAASTDMTNYFIQRTAEESFIDSCKLLSSGIKLGHNLGYNPIRNTPAETELKIVINGPLPKSLQAGATVYFPQNEVKLSLNGKPFVLSTTYSYTFTEADIEAGKNNASWSKTLVNSKPKDENSSEYVIDGVKYWDNNSALLKPIKAYQGEFKTTQIYGMNNTDKIGKNYQLYVIDDIKFSNWYAQRDPNAFFNDTYTPKNSFVKIGIGPSSDIAFSDNNIYTVEEHSIYLNDDVQKADVSVENYEPLKVCRIFTNPDKTISIEFGDGTIVSNGINKNTDSIFVQYFITDGAAANMPNSTNSQFSSTSKVYASQPSGLVNLTSNIQFQTNSDVVNGCDFEELSSIKVNAPIFYASNRKLITNRDFVAYFKTLSDPINIKNAVAWGQKSSDNYEQTQANVIKYAVASTAYKRTGKTNSVVNAFDDSVSDQFTLYKNGKEYIKHLLDDFRTTYDYTNINAEQHGSTANDSWLQNIQKINSKIDSRVLVGSTLFSIPPIVHYYDLVGDVEVNSIQKLQDFKTEVENEIYEWLDNEIDFKHKIYKSDFVKFFTKHDETVGVNLDLRVSDIEKTTKTEKTVYYDDDDENILTLIESNMPTDTGKDDKDSFYWNTIKIPNKDGAFTKEMFEGKRINLTINGKRMQIYYYGQNSENRGSTDNVFDYPIDCIPNIVEENGEYIILSFFTKFEIVNTESIIKYNKIVLNYSSTNDLTSKSNFSATNSASYGLENKYFGNVITILNNWYSNSSTTKTADRPIQLPYELGFTIEQTQNKTRSETIERRGVNTSSNLSSQITEKSFWNYIVPEIFTKAFYGKYNDGFENLIYDIYTLIKPSLSDSLLDDNNNITFYSLDNELAVVRLNITYKYKV